MEPISMIVGALVAGSSAALKDTASQAVKDAYSGLRTLVIHHWNNKVSGNDSKLEQEAKILISNLEDDPETFQVPVEKKLSEIIPEPSAELVDKAQALYELLDKNGFDTGKYNVTVQGGKGVQVGDNNTQINKF